MRLLDYIDSNPIPKGDFIFLQKFESFFDEIHNGDNVIYFRCDRKDTGEKLVDLFNWASEHSDRKFIIVSSNGDTDMPCIEKKWLESDNIQWSDKLQDFIETCEIDYFLNKDVIGKIPGNLLFFCHSVIGNGETFRMIPLGRDFKGRSVIENSDFDMKKKDILCYFNCSLPPDNVIHWYGMIRKHIYEGIKNKDFVVKENVDFYINRNLNFENFYNYYDKISRSKFIIAPRGCSIDSYRLWDAIYFGCIPIVVKYEGYNQFEDLPILFIDKWEDYSELTEEYLNHIWDKFSGMDFNYEKLKFSYWENEITSTINEFRK
jgi:hypothetical protein